MDATRIRTVYKLEDGFDMCEELVRRLSGKTLKRRVYYLTALFQHSDGTYVSVRFQAIPLVNTNALTIRKNSGDSVFFSLLTRFWTEWMDTCVFTGNVLSGQLKKQTPLAPRLTYSKDPCDNVVLLELPPTATVGKCFAKVVSS